MEPTSATAAPVNPLLSGVAAKPTPSTMTHALRQDSTRYSCLTAGRATDLEGPRMVGAGLRMVSQFRVPVDEKNSDKDGSRVRNR